MKTKKIYKLLSLVLAFAFIFSSFGFINARLVKAETNEVTTLINEGFNNGTTAPVGWTFKDIDDVYRSSDQYDAAAPSLKFDSSNDSVTTPAFSNPSKLTFWVKGISEQKPDMIVLVRKGNGDNWELLEHIKSIANLGITKTYDLDSSVTQIKFMHVGGQGQFALDDVNVVRITANTNPPTDNTKKVTIAKLNKTSIVINQGKFEYVNIITSAKSLNLGTITYDKQSVITVSQNKKNKRLLRVLVNPEFTSTVPVTVTAYIPVNGQTDPLKLIVKILPTKAKNVKPVKPVKPVTTKKN